MKKIGVLKYNYENNRYGISDRNKWLDYGLHCGEIFEIFINNEWIAERIEYSDDWYLVFSKLKGSYLENLKVRY